MARQDHRGNRKKRKERIKRRNLELGYYLIYTDTTGTERAYFEGLHKELPETIRNKIQIKVVDGIKTRELVNAALKDSSYDPQFRKTWIVFDRDQVSNFDKIVEKACENGLQVAWSNPCFEIWLHAYFDRIPTLDTSKSCCMSFKQLCSNKLDGYEYDKADPQLYKRLYKIGSETKAIQLAKRKYNYFKKDRAITVPSQMVPCTTVYQLVEEIREKI